MDNKKKNEERVILNTLLMLLNAPEITIEESESPDFILNKQGKKIGVEIARIFYNGENHIGKNANMLRDKLRKMLKTKGKYINRLKDCVSEDEFIVAKGYKVCLPPFYIETIDKTSSELFVNSFGEWLDAGCPNDSKKSQIFQIFDIPYKRTISTHDFNKYYSDEVIDFIYMIGSFPVLDHNNNLAPITIEHPLHEIIRQKNERLRNVYISKNPDIKEWWLCLSTTTDSTIGACKYPFDSNYPNSFDRVFIIDPNRYQVYEIERN